MSELAQPKPGRLRGHGQAGEATLHWWAQRLTSVALVPLGVWFAASMVGLADADHADVTVWLGVHGNALLMVLFVGTLFHHAHSGVQVIVEDYVHHPAAKTATLIAAKFLFILLAASAVLAVLRIHIGI